MFHGLEIYVVGLLHTPYNLQGAYKLTKIGNKKQRICETIYVLESSSTYDTIHVVGLCSKKPHSEALARSKKMLANELIKEPVPGGDPQDRVREAEVPCYLWHEDKKQRLTEFEPIEFDVFPDLSGAVAGAQEEESRDTAAGTLFWPNGDPLFCLPDLTTSVSAMKPGAHTGETSTQDTHSEKHQVNLEESSNSHKLSWDKKAYSAVVHLLNAHFLKEQTQARAVEALKTHREEVVAVHLPFSPQDLVTGSFDLVEGKVGLEVILSMGCHVRTCERSLSLQMTTDQTIATFGPGEVFVLSIAVLLIWTEAGVSFKQKPLSTLWKFWGSEGSKQRLGCSLYCFLSRLDKLTRMARGEDGSIDLDKIPLVLERNDYALLS